MGLFSRLFSRKAGIQSLPEFSTWPDSKTGVQINTSRALEVATVLACARAIAEGVAQVPIKFYRIDAGTGRRVPLLSHPLLSLLARQPNPWQTSFEFRETLLFHLVLCGNAFVYVNRVRGEVRELIPIEPGKVLVDRKPDMSLTYQITWDDGRSPILTTGDVWHLRGPSWNSWMGLEAIKLAREAIGLALATEEAHARLHKNGVRPSGVWSVDGALTEPQHEQLSRWIAKHYSGSDNGGKPLVMDRAAKWLQQTMSGVDAQHLETRKHQVEEICRALRVIPMMAGYSDKTSTYASAEQMFIAHVVHTITPWATRIEQSAERALLGDETDIDIRFDLKGLMRGAAKDRAEYLSRALGSGGSPAWMTPNEAREEDGLDWIAGGDDLPKPPQTTTADGGAVDAAA
jgi:HK97 family phage portal protein